MLACVEMTKNRMFKINLKIKTISFKHEWKVNDEKEILKMSKALEVQTVETEAAKNKAQVVTHVMKDRYFNPPIDEESYVVVSKEESIPTTTSKNKEKIKKRQGMKI